MKKPKISEMNLTHVVIILILISTITTFISFHLFTHNKNFKYDLARPDVKRRIKLADDKAVSDHASFVQASDVKNVQDYISNELNQTYSLHSFDKSALGNSTLGIDQ